MDNGLMDTGTGLWKDDQIVFRDEILTGYTEYKNKLDTELKANAEGFVRIGYLLKVARDTNILADSGYKNVAEFAQAEYGLTKDIVSRYIAINDKYAENGYSDKLQSKYEGFGVAKLQEMLTLPDAIIEEIEPTLTKREIVEIKKEVAAEEAITPIEAAIEAADPKVIQEEKELTLTQRIWKDIIKSLWDKYNVKDKNTTLHKIIATEYPFVTNDSFTKPLESALYELIAPSGTATLWARIPGVGRYMVTVKGLDEPINMVNARDGSKINTSFADAVRDIADIFDGECTPESWERVYGLPNPQYEETETKAPGTDKKIPNNTEKAPKNTENAQKDAENTQNLPENAQNHLEKGREYEEKEKVAPVQQKDFMPKPGTWTYKEPKEEKHETKHSEETKGSGDDGNEDTKVQKAAADSTDKAKNIEAVRPERLGQLNVGDVIVNVDGTRGTMLGYCAGEYKIQTETGLILVNENSTVWKKEDPIEEEKVTEVQTDDTDSQDRGAGQEKALAAIYTFKDKAETILTICSEILNHEYNAEDVTKSFEAILEMAEKIKQTAREFLESEGAGEDGND